MAKTIKFSECLEVYLKENRIKTKFIKEIVNGVEREVDATNAGIPTEDRKTLYKEKLAERLENINISKRAGIAVAFLFNKGITNTGDVHIHKFWLEHSKAFTLFSKQNKHLAV